jgi:beta propeller repeat protein
MSRLAISVVVALALTLVVAPFALAAPSYAPEYPLVTGPGSQQSPDLALGEWGWPTVSEDDSAGTWHTVASWSGDNLVLEAGGGQQRHPTVSQNAVVHEDDRGGDWDLYRSWLPLRGYPAPVELDVPFATGPDDQLDPAIHGDTVVYESGAPGHRDIFARSISTGVERRLTSNAADQVDPAIEGDIVVFADNRNGNWDIYRFDLATGKTARLTTNGATQQAPQIGHGVVVYQDHRNRNWDIYAYTLKTGKERRLTTDAHEQTMPAIGNSRSVVYQDERGGSSDIYVCDLVTGANRPVTDDPAAQTAPDMAGNVLVWTDQRAGDADIYGCTVHYPTLTLQTPYEAPAYGSTVRLRGGLTFDTPTPAAATVALRTGTKSHNVAVGSFDYGTGSYAYALKNVVRKVTVQARYTGGSAQLPAAPISKTIVPKALLSRPVLTTFRPPSSAAVVTASLKVSGSLKPRHKAGSAAVTLQVWTKGPIGTWTLAKSMKVKVHDQNGASAYSLTALAHANIGWSYKVVAIHNDADHAPTESAFSRVVKG